MNGYSKRLIHFMSLKMNTDFDYYQIQILNNIKEQIIEKRKSKQKKIQRSF